MENCEGSRTGEWSKGTESGGKAVGGGAGIWTGDGTFLSRVTEVGGLSRLR